MSEAKAPSPFMQYLDRWTDQQVIVPLAAALQQATDREGLESSDERRERISRTVSTVKAMIREKVLQSYKNGRGTRQTAALPTDPRPVPSREFAR